ncbi:hypothetical protein [Brevibacillus agri]|uniref:hypothetical protein n=1 Tax=Brevibacillus agri TaxID=51101 RepID=UPI0018CE7CBC|nr:hypothetical protein [Brevibacillus agri]MBG9568418.1 hypothetical protein [Brevibacillus agri]
MDKKKMLWLLLVPLLVIVVMLMVKGKSNWMELEEKQDMFQVDLQNCNCERPDHEYHPEHYLVPKDVIINFFGYLKAGEYANVASFFDPDVMVAYFYEEKTKVGYDKKVKLFGDTLSRNGTLEDARIISLEKIGLSRYLVKVEIRYNDASTVEKEITLEERVTEERLERETFIITAPNKLLEK